MGAAATSRCERPTRRASVWSGDIAASLPPAIASSQTMERIGLGRLNASSVCRLRRAPTVPSGCVSSRADQRRRVFGVGSPKEHRRVWRRHDRPQPGRHRLRIRAIPGVVAVMGRSRHRPRRAEPRRAAGSVLGDQYSRHLPLVGGIGSKKNISYINRNLKKSAFLADRG